MTSDPLAQITPLLLCFNEEANIARTLDGLNWASRIVVVDSGSTDRTLEILSLRPRVHVEIRSFDSHAQQWNYGLSLIESSWVLTLDADYFVTPSLLCEIRSLLACEKSTGVSGYYIPFRYCISGKPLRGTVLPARLALFAVRCGYYADDGHTQVLRFSGVHGMTRQYLLHDDRKSLKRWLWAQNRYLSLEVDKLLASRDCDLTFADRLRKRTVFAPFAVFMLCLFWNRCLLDGWRGWFYAFQRLYVEVLLSLMLWERRHLSDHSDHDQAAHQP